MTEEHSLLYVYCASRCANDRLEPAQCENYCSDCGTLLVPSPACLCGRVINPKLRFRSKFCGNCGRAWTEAFVQEQVQLRESRWKALTNGTH